MDETKNRINIDDLPKPEEELTTDEQNNVGGGHSGGANVLLGDGSVRFVKSTTDGNTVGGTLSTDTSTKSG